MNTLPHFVMKFFSTSPIEFDRLIAFSSLTQDIFGEAPMSGEFVLNENKASVAVFDDLHHFFDTRSLDWLGCLTIVFGTSNGCSGRCDILRLRDVGEDGQHSGARAGYRMHEFVVRISPRHRSNGLRPGQLLDYFCGISELFDVEFALGVDGENFASPNYLAHGLESGLPGAYRINAFGATFSNLIGRNAILGLSDFNVRSLENGGVVVALDDCVENFPEYDVFKKSKMLKDAIGDEYFANADASSIGLSGGSIGIFSFISSIIKANRNFRSADRLAKLRPVFDWSGVIVDK